MTRGAKVIATSFADIGFDVEIEALELEEGDEVEVLRGRPDRRAAPIPTVLHAATRQVAGIRLEGPDVDVGDARPRTFAVAFHKAHEVREIGRIPRNSAFAAAFVAELLQVDDDEVPDGAGGLQVARIDVFRAEKILPLLP